MASRCQGWNSESPKRARKAKSMSVMNERHRSAADEGMPELSDAGSGSCLSQSPTDELGDFVGTLRDEHVAGTLQNMELASRDLGR